MRLLTLFYHAFAMFSFFWLLAKTLFLFFQWKMAKKPYTFHKKSRPEDKAFLHDEMNSLLIEKDKEIQLLAGDVTKVTREFESVAAINLNYQTKMKELNSQVETISGVIKEKEEIIAKLTTSPPKDQPKEIENEEMHGIVRNLRKDLKEKESLIRQLISDNQTKESEATTRFEAELKEATHIQKELSIKLNTINQQHIEERNQFENRKLALQAEIDLLTEMKKEHFNDLKRKEENMAEEFAVEYEKKVKEVNDLKIEMENWQKLSEENEEEIQELREKIKNFEKETTSLKENDSSSTQTNEEFMKEKQEMAQEFAVEYEKKVKEVNDLKIEMENWQKLSEENEEEIQELREKIKNFEKETTSLKENDSSSTQTNEEFMKEKQEMAQEFALEYEKKVKEVNDLKIEMENWQKLSEENEEENEELRETIKNLEKKTTSLKENDSSSTQTNEEFMKEKQEMAQEFAVEYEKKVKEVNDLKIEMENWQKLSEENEEENEELRETIKNLEKKTTSLKENDSSSTQTNEEFMKEKQEMAQEFAVEYEKKVKEVNDLKIEMENWQKLSEENEEEIQELREKIKNLEKETTSLKENDSSSTQTNEEFMKEKQEMAQEFALEYEKKVKEVNDLKIEMENWQKLSEENEEEIQELREKIKNFEKETTSLKENDSTQINEEFMKEKQEMAQEFAVEYEKKVKEVNDLKIEMENWQKLSEENEEENEELREKIKNLEKENTTINEKEVDVAPQMKEFDLGALNLDNFLCKKESEAPPFTFDNFKPHSPSPIVSSTNDQPSIIDDYEGSTLSTTAQLSPVKELLVLDIAMSQETNPSGLRKAKKTNLNLKGGRPGMEDANFFAYPFLDNPNSALLIVCDGFAGPEAAQSAVKIIPKEMAKLVETLGISEDATEILKQTIANTDQQMLEHEYVGCTCTIVFLWYYKNQRYVQTANLGDSTAFLCRAKQSVQLTIDHKPSSNAEKERMRASGLEINEKQTRINGIAVSRALGAHFAKEMEVGMIGDPYISSPLPLSPQDSAVLVASDGLWDVVSGQEAFDLFCQQTGPVHNRTKKLIAHALTKRGCNDNITIGGVLL